MLLISGCLFIRLNIEFFFPDPKHPKQLLIFYMDGQEFFMVYFMTSSKLIILNRFLVLIQ